MFFALWPNAAQREAIARAAAAAIQAVAAKGARPVPAENFHFTLCFIGEVGDGALAAMKSVAAEVRAPPVIVTLERLEHWRSAGVLCATPARDGPSELAQRIAAAVAAVGIAPDGKPFRAHVTLARKVSRATGAVAIAPVPLEFDRFALIESRPGRDGSIYSVVGSWPLYIE